MRHWICCLEEISKTFLPKCNKTSTLNFDFRIMLGGGRRELWRGTFCIDWADNRSANKSNNRSANRSDNRSNNRSNNKSDNRQQVRKQLRRQPTDNRSDNRLDNTHFPDDATHQSNTLEYFCNTNKENKESKKTATTKLYFKKFSCPSFWQCHLFAAVIWWRSQWFSSTKTLPKLLARCFSGPPVRIRIQRLLPKIQVKCFSDL